MIWSVFRLIEREKIRIKIIRIHYLVFDQTVKVTSRSEIIKQFLKELLSYKKHNVVCVIASCKITVHAMLWRENIIVMYFFDGFGYGTLYN